MIWSMMCLFLIDSITEIRYLTGHLTKPVLLASYWSLLSTVHVIESVLYIDWFPPINQPMVCFSYQDLYSSSSICFIISFLRLLFVPYKQSKFHWCKLAMKGIQLQFNWAMILNKSWRYYTVLSENRCRFYESLMMFFWSKSNAALASQRRMKKMSSFIQNFFFFF